MQVDWKLVADEKPPSKRELMVIFQYAGDNSREFFAAFFMGGNWCENHTGKRLGRVQGKVTHWAFPPDYPPKTD